MIEVQAPGKLYIAGEYAVVEPGQPAVLIAVNRYMRARLESAGTAGRDTTNLTTAQVITKALETGKVGRDYALSAAVVMEKFRAEKNLERRQVDMIFQSDLRNGDGTKYGLGSSAAITAAVVVAFDKLYDLGLSPREHFQLGMLASIRIDPNVSGGDLAAAILGGWINYRSPDRSVLPDVWHTGVTQALEHPGWEPMTVETLEVSEDFNVLIGWTGTPASTTSLVSQVKKSIDPACYNRFIASSEQAVNQLVTGLNTGNEEQVFQAITTNRELLGQLGEQAGVQIETPLLNQLCELANTEYSRAKTSGAGGGDCGIAITTCTTNQDIYQAWQRAGILPLDITVAPNGAS